MLLVQVPAPELLVVLVVRVAPVYGGGLVGDELPHGAQHDTGCDTPGVQLDEPESLAPNHTSLTKKH